MLVDSHVHVASSDTARYPRRPSGLGSDWFTSPRVGVEDLLAVLDANGVERAVVVQAVGAYGYDCRYAIDAVATNPQRLALVGAIDLGAPDPAEAVLALAAAAEGGGAGPLAGVRLFGVDGTPPTWLVDGRGASAFAAAAELGTTLVPTLFGDALGPLARLVEDHPSVTVALDHCGFPDLAGGPPYRRATSLFDLAGAGGVHLKVSSHVLEAADAAGGAAAMVGALAGAFGPERLCWGSDYPQTRHLTYDAMLGLGRSSCRHLPEKDQVAFLGDNARRLWWPAG